MKTAAAETALAWKKGLEGFGLSGQDLGKLAGAREA